MRDIQEKKDIQFLVGSFYNQALADPMIGPVFIKARFNLEKHIPTMVSFWETILFDVISYSGNPMLKHISLNNLVPLLPEHFDRWMQIWRDTIQLNFDGPLAEKAITRAQSIAQLIQNKISYSQNQH